MAKAIGRGTLPSLTKLSLCTCELTAAGAYAIARAVAKLPNFRSLHMDGNAICERGVDEIRGLMIRAGKTIEDMEDNDEEGEDDLEEELVKEEPAEEEADLEAVTAAMKAAEI